MHPLAEMFDKAIFDEYFCAKAESSDSSPTVSRPEVDHLIHISSINTMEWDPLSAIYRRPFTELDAYWLFFYAFANCSSTPSTDGIVVKRSNESSWWPFGLIIQVGKKCYSYKPKSNFLVVKLGLPRLAVAIEVDPDPQDSRSQDSCSQDSCSQDSYSPPVDYLRLMIQGG